MQDQLTPTTTSDLQQPRSDLQPSNNSLQQGGGAAGSSSQLSQQQLSDKQLRVGDSGTTVQNTTSAAPYKSESAFPSLWMWLLLALIGVVAALFVLRRRIKSVESIQPAADDPEVGMPKPKKKPAQKKARPTGKPRGTTKRKYRR